MSGIVKIETIMVATSIVAFAALAVTGHLMQARGAVRDEAALGRVMLPVIFVIFLVFGFGLIGIALHLFLAGQAGIGNGDLGLIAFLRRSETSVVLGVWTFLLAGTALAYPALRRDMLGTAPSVGPSQGTLCADIGMTMDEVRAASTLALARTIDVTLTDSTQTVGDVVFDLDLHGTRFERCRYYFITTGSHHDGHVDSLNIGISTTSRSRAEIDADADELRRRLAAEGWTPGRFVWHSARDIALHGGATSDEGRYWARGQTLIILSSRRVDEAQRAEDPRVAGKFILFIDVVPRDKESYQALEYGPAPSAALEARSGR